MTRFRRLYLHVGTEKTGTTSVQRALFTHRDRLRELNYFYPKAFAVGRNMLLATMFHPDPMTRPLWKINIDDYGGTQQSFRDGITAVLEQELEGVEADTLILSSEFLAAQSNVDELRSFCDSLAAETKIVMYIREPASLMASLHSTFVKSGGIGFPALERVEQGALPILLDTKRSLERLLTHFDPADMNVRVFEPGQLVNGNSIDDFLEVIGLGDHGGDFAIDRQNESLSREGLAVLHAVNAHLPMIVDGARSTVRPRLLNAMADLDRHGNFGTGSMSPETIELIRDLTAADNEWIRQRFFPDQSSVFSETEQSNTPTDINPLDYAARLIAGAFEQIDEFKRA